MGRRIANALLLVALFTAAVFATDLPEVAVCVTGELGQKEKKILSSSMLVALIKSGDYTGSERANSFNMKIESELAKGSSGDLDNERISVIAKEFGAKFVCKAITTSVFNDYHVSARIIDVETAKIVLIGESHGKIETISDIRKIAGLAVINMLGKRAAEASPAPLPVPVAAAPAPAPVAVAPALPQSRAPVVYTPVPVEPAAPAPVQAAAPTPVQAAAPAAEADDKKGVIGIYVTSEGGNIASKAIVPVITTALVKAMGQNASNMTKDIGKIAGKSGQPLSAAQIKEVGNQLGIKYLCIAKIRFTGSSFGLELQLANTTTGAIVTSVNAANLNQNTIATSMIKIALDLLAGLGK